MEFSIIYTTYRPGGFDILADSLRNQTMGNYELIIIDDYPLDRRDAVKRYLEDKGVPVAYIGPCKPKCFPEIAYNMANAINTGFLLSTKEIVILIQDYQWLPPDCLEKFAKRHTLFKDNYCIVLPGQMWNDTRPRNNEGLISIWSQPWKGRPEENGCQEAMVSVYSGKPSSLWIPEAWEYACIAFPWNVISEANGWPECLDSYEQFLPEPLARRFELAGGKPYVDKDNFMEMLNHRVWLPHELWWAGYRTPTGSTEFIERENCFALKTHTRGKAYWLETGEVRSDADEECVKTKQAELVKINLGSFVDTIGYGWENWDILPIQQHITPGHKFKQWDIRRGLPLPGDSVDLIRCSHLIEHLTLEESHNLCRELYRALKVGGLARISTPDAKIIIRHYQSRDMSFFNQIQPPEYIQAPTEGEKLSRLLFSDPAEHKAIYNFEMVKNFLEQAGFERIYNVSPGFSHSATMRNETEDQHIEISLTVEAVK